mmetsp:Transcript_5953/g.14363  ORF Transcript_5953/g.14363 Transcript_5953/m.14363 type:complete len:231 (-) Transcript_5953:403-1095(-)
MAPKGLLHRVQKVANHRRVPPPGPLHQQRLGEALHHVPEGGGRGHLDLGRKVWVAGHQRGTPLRPQVVLVPPPGGGRRRRGGGAVREADGFEGVTPPDRLLDHPRGGAVGVRLPQAVPEARELLLGLLDVLVPLLELGNQHPVPPLHLCERRVALRQQRTQLPDLLLVRDHHGLEGAHPLPLPAVHLAPRVDCRSRALAVRGGEGGGVALPDLLGRERHPIRVEGPEPKV